MKALKNIFLSFLMVISMAAISTSAMAAEEGDKSAHSAQATVEKIRETLDAIENGADPEKVLDLINEARQLNKEITGDAVDMKRQKASGKLKKARSEAKKSELQPAEMHLRDALKRYTEINNYYKNGKEW